MSAHRPLIICLMGPTASGKTPLAIEMVQRLPCDIISVDSAMVYRDMNIGTAKPDAEILKIAPHRLIDLLDPKDAYSAGKFRQDALREINDIVANGKIPLLVGGTMMYFRVLQQGLATLPTANTELRNILAAREEQEGLPALHAWLSKVDPEAAAKIHTNDSQRIQRALEVYLLTDKTLSALQKEDTNPLAQYTVRNIALAPLERSHLHQRIELRFQQMLEQGFIAEVEQLYQRGDLHADLPSIRSVGYRQVWEYLSEQVSKQTMIDKAVAATRQLAKRQLTWLRTWPAVDWLDSDDKHKLDKVMKLINPGQ